MRDRIARVTNIRVLWAASETLRTRATGVPGIGIVWGASGAGKTTAITWLANQPGINAVYVRAMKLWTPTAMLGAIMRELNAEPKPRCATMIDYITRTLARENRPLFVDESDYLAESKKLLDALRDLHDMATTPLVLIGMKDFQRRVMHREQLAGRVSQWVEFQPADLKDARLLCDELCEFKVADDLLASLHRSCAGSIRGLVVGFSRIEHLARKQGLSTVKLADWDDRPFTFSRIPKMPMAVAA